MADCPFCLIVCGRAPAEIVHRWDDALAIVPLSPVTPGHTLIVPNEHVAHALIKPSVASLAMRRATEIAHHPCNLITSVGAAATQTVGHLHLHIVPRREGDGLALPWSAGVAAGPQATPPCRVCEGTGRVDRPCSAHDCNTNACLACNGTGRVVAVPTDHEDQP